MNCKICFERLVPSSWDAPWQSSRLKGDSRLALINEKLWPNNSVLSCTFLHGSERQKNMVETIAKEWERYANIVFNFTHSRSAEIRIAFNSGEGCWSALGTDALCVEYFPLHGPTMNLGWLDDDTPVAEYRRVVLHEFGHVLGCIHEHQTPAADFEWNKTAVLNAYMGPPNYWTLGEIETNILSRSPVNSGAFTAFDSDSIMLYSFSRGLFKSGECTKVNSELSRLDKEMIAKMYPKDLVCP